MSGERDTCDLLCLDLPRAEALRRARPETELPAAAAAAKALADPTRLQVAAALRDGGELCVCDLAWVCERSDKLVSHHVRQLRAAGLVRSRRDGKMVMYALTDAGATLLGAVLPTAEVPRVSVRAADGVAAPRRPSATPAGSAPRGWPSCSRGPACSTWPSRVASASGRASPPVRSRSSAGASRRSSRASPRRSSSGASPARAGSPTPPSTAPQKLVAVQFFILAPYVLSKACGR